MNVQLPNRMDKPEFLAWVQRQEGRYELAEGRVVMMTGGSFGHATIMRRLSNALERQLDGSQWMVVTSDFGVEMGVNTIRYPDVMVVAANTPWASLAASAPALIAEVVSPSSRSVDLGAKAAEYLRLPSLLAYLVLSQDEAKAWVWLRGEPGFLPGADMIVGQESIITIPNLRLELSLSEIYRGVTSLPSQ